MFNFTRRAGLAALATAAITRPALAADTKTRQSYGRNREQSLDIYQRDGLANAPVLIWVHGGAWRQGDNQNVRSKPDFCKRNGLLLVSVEYRKYPDTDAQGCAEDLASAFAWIKGNIAKFGGDPSKLYLLGHSAGAHMSALIGVDPVYLGKYQLAPTDIAGSILLDGAAYNLPPVLNALGAGRAKAETIYEQAFGDKAAALSPALLAKPGRAYPPMLIFFVQENPGSPFQSRSLAMAVRAAGGKVSNIQATDKTHDAIAETFGEANDPETALAEGFLKTGQLPPQPAAAGRGG